MSILTELQRKRMEAILSFAERLSLGVAVVVAAGVIGHSATLVPSKLFRVAAVWLLAGFGDVIVYMSARLLVDDLMPRTIKGWRRSLGAGAAWFLVAGVGFVTLYIGARSVDLPH